MSSSVVFKLFCRRLINAHKSMISFADYTHMEQTLQRPKMNRAVHFRAFFILNKPHNVLIVSILRGWQKNCSKA